MGAVVLGLGIGLGLQELRSAVGSMQRAASTAPPSAAVSVSAPSARPGAVDPLATSPTSVQIFEHIRLAANGPLVTVRFTNARPQILSLVDEESDREIYHLTNRFGPGNPQVDQGFTQVFTASLHQDGGTQVVLTYGPCAATCAATQVMVLGMNVDHVIVRDELALNGLQNAVAEASSGLLLISEWPAGHLQTVRRFSWDAQTQQFFEQ
jgi:hypothetical protein